MLPDDRFCGPNSTKWLWYDSKHSTTNLMYRTAKGIFISVAVLGYNVRVPPSLFLSSCRFSHSLSLSLSLRTCVPLSRIVRFRRPSIPREIQTTRSVFRFLSFSLLIISTFLFRFSALFLAFPSPFPFSIFSVESCVVDGHNFAHQSWLW